MGTQSRNDIIFIPGSREKNAAEFNVVSRLLAIAFVRQNDEMIFQLHDLFSDAGSNSALTASLRVAIGCENYIQIGQKIELTLNGFLENQQGGQSVFTLYVFIQLNSTEHDSPKKICRKIVQECPPLIQFTQSVPRLSESVFELSIYQKNSSDQNSASGWGRGFMLFDRNHGIKVK